MIPNTRPKIILTALFILAVFQLSFGASFDCSRAGTLVEKTICSDQKLSEFDELLAVTYKEALANTSNKSLLKVSQRDWLKSKRNLCQDTECIRQQYVLRILELSNTVKNFSISGRYERYYHGKPSAHPSDLSILELKDNRIYVYGVALWIKNAEKGIIHIGEIDGSFPLVENKVKYQDEYGCNLMMNFDKDTLVISDTSSECGGHNVTFDGLYRKTR